MPAPASADRLFPRQKSPLCDTLLGLAPVLLAAVAATPAPSFAASSAWTPSGGQAAPQAAWSSVSARVAVVQGRATLVSESEGMLTLRRGASRRATGDAQLEVTSGCQARISLDGEVTLDVYGPSSVAWRSGRQGVVLVFQELGWVDVDVRSGRHTMVLPSDWRARFGRSSFHLRALAGGPTELRHNAGSAVTLAWRGDETRVRPPVSVYPGSSIRLDRPRHERIEGESVAQDRAGAWRGVAQDAWPWRERTDTAAQVREREVLRGETQVLDEIPGAPDGKVARLRVYQAGGSSYIRPLRRRREEGQTYAQVPLGPGGRPGEAPRVEVITRPGFTDLTCLDLPRRPETGPVAAPSLGTLAHRAPGNGPPLQESPSQEPAVLPAPPGAQPKKPFRSSEWRGLALSSLNGVGEIAAERGSGVEVRVLGAGRIKVFVSASSPSPRWCFAPGADYLLSPGAVVVFEKSGDVRMSFGEVEEQAPAAGRPSFGQLDRQ